MNTTDKLTELIEKSKVTGQLMERMRIITLLEQQQVFGKDQIIALILQEQK